MPSTSDRPPFESYKGTEPYVFISYAHRDCGVVFPELTRLKAMGVNIWYDEGIDPGNEWPDEIATALRGCAFFIFFVSPQSTASVNCRNEAYFALELKKPFLSIYVEETDVKSINAGLGLSIGSLQALMRHRMDDEAYERKLAKSLGTLVHNVPPAPSVESISEAPVAAPSTPEPVEPIPVAKTAPPVKKSSFPLVMILAWLFLLGLLIAGAAGYLVWQKTVQDKKIEEIAEESALAADAAKKALIEKMQEDTAAEAVREKADALAAQAKLESMRPHDGKGYKNSLSMIFVPAGTKGILFCLHDTTVKDFQTFVTSSGYDATSGCFSYKEGDGWKQRGDNWRSPGFPQSGDCPVVGVSWNDAEAFCKWQTDRARKFGSLLPNQCYRLPTDAEWTTAAGTATYPWGETWPPPLTAGNYCRVGDDVKLGKLPGADGYPFTAPVGRFMKNQYGLYDMSGNAWEWCEDWYDKGMNSPELLTKFPMLATAVGAHVLRGGSWEDFDPLRLQTRSHNAGRPDLRGTRHTFRCVIVVIP